jgi:hypothetical protein
MYGLFIDKSAIDSKSLLEHLSIWKQKNSLQTQEYQINNVDDITTTLKENGSKFNTVVAIGSPEVLESLIADSRLLNPETAFAYVPTSKSMLSKRLGIKDYKDGFDAIAQRKVVELTALSVNQHFFLFDYVLSTEPNKSNEPVKSIIRIDKNLEIKMNTYRIVIHNRNQEVSPHSTALLIEIFNKRLKHDKSSNVLKIPGVNMGQNTTEDTLQLRLPAQNIAIESSQSMNNMSGKSMKNPIRIGFRKKTIRIIVKRGQEIQSIMSPGLIS